MRDRTLLVRLYRLILRLMPAEYRQRYGCEASELFAAITRSERPDDRFARLRWSAMLIFRGVVAAFGMHLDRWHRRRRTAPDAPRVHSTGFWRDVRYVLRGLRSTPWYALTATAVIAVPMAMAATTFAIVDGVLFRPLPYPGAGQLVALLPKFDGPARTTEARVANSVSESDLRHWRAAVPDVPVTGYRAQPWGGVGEGITNTMAGVAVVEQNFFDVIGVHPLAGGFVEEDFRSSPNVRPVIASYDVWQGRFQRAAIIGHEIITNPARGVGVRIVGVMPRGFTFPSGRWDVSFLTPYVSTADSRTNPRARTFTEVIARLPAEMTIATLPARLRQAASAAAAEFPAPGPAPRGWSETDWRRQGPYDVVDVEWLARTLGRRDRPMFEAVFSAVALLVVLAAVNVSSLMAARALDRRPQMDIRRSLGAATGAIARLWVIESLVLAAAGGVIAALSAPLVFRVMSGLLPEELVLLKPATFDWRVAGFGAITLFLLAGVIALLPIRRSLVDGSTRAATAQVRTRSRFLIVLAQVGVAFALTVLGSLLVGSLLVVYADKPPIHTQDVVAIGVMLNGPGGAFEESQQRSDRERALREAFARLPGVRAVGSSGAQVLAGGKAVGGFMAPAGRRHPRNIDTWPISEGFYDVLEPEIVAGRLHSNDELRSAAPLIVVSEQAAKAYWPDGPAAGNTLTHSHTNRTFTVIGVVREIKWSAWDTPSPVIYAPYQITSRYPWISFVLRTDGRTGRVEADALRAIETTDRLARPDRAGTLDEWFRESVSLRRFQSWLFGGLAAAALLIVGAGILGLLAMSAARRTREVGIRCALGATRRGVVALMLREQLTSVVAGLVIGGAVAAWAVRPLRSYLYQIEATDVRVWLTAAALVLATAAAGTLIPAIRASRIDPLQALRQD